MMTDRTGIGGLYFAINLHLHIIVLTSNKKIAFPIKHLSKKNKINLAARPDEVKQIITDAFTLMAART